MLIAPTLERGKSLLGGRLTWFLFQKSLPVSFSLIALNLTSIVDALMLGAYQGAEAVSAVGVATLIYMLSVSIFFALSASMQVHIAGTDKSDFTALLRLLNTNIVWCFILGVLFLAIIYTQSKAISNLLNPDPAVQVLVHEYLIWRCLIGFVPAALVRGTFRGFWMGLCQFHYLLYIMLVTLSLNIGLNWLLIYGHWGFPALGVKGAAIASGVAGVVEAIIYLFLLLRWIKGKSLPMPKMSCWFELNRLAFPVMLTKLFQYFWPMVLYVIVGAFGTQELALSHVTLTIVAVVIMLMKGVTKTSQSLIGRALGRGNYKAALKWRRRSQIVTLLVAFVFFSIVNLFAEPILIVFLPNIENAEMGVALFRIGTAIWLCNAISLSVASYLLANRKPVLELIVTVPILWGLVLPAFYVSLNLFNAFLAGWVCFMILEAIRAAIFLVTQRWLENRVWLNSARHKLRYLENHDHY